MADMQGEPPAMARDADERDWFKAEHLYLQEHS